MSDGIESDLTEHVADTSRERLVRGFFFVCAAASVLTTFGIVVALVVPSLRFFSVTASILDLLFGIATEQTVSVTDFLFGTNWAPSIRPHEYGVIPLVSATFAVVIGSSFIALPFGLGTAVYLSEYASPRARSILKPALEVLAGIPTVVYGVFALLYLTPALDAVLPVDLSTFNLLSACIMVGIMIIPMVSSISEDAMSAVPDDLRQAGYGMGATKFDVSVGVVIPAAISGIASAFILAISRAIGETMIVVVAAGSSARLVNPLLPGAYLEAAQPMTAAMVQLATGDISAQGPGYRSLFAIGLTLFVITLAMNIVSDLIAERYREEYE
ncbi:phosphate ABC transporter permease subunit PstC [Halorarius halobius]|uniref:phosphate ABC transporter permease subunit PstC n=1 Tax=Halorarius halobius TaxID=2962671 RepID=UPI0020CE5A71|nr:phosphate ABC transporter permease subunit PstC [Halorarius halobius]